MSTSTQGYYLPAEIIGKLVSTPAGDLAPVLPPQDEAGPFTMLDSFDQVLRRSGRVLIDTGEALELWGAEGGWLSQAHAQAQAPTQAQAHAPTQAQAQTKVGKQAPADKPQFIGDLPAGHVRDALGDVSPLRRLLPVGTGERRQAAVAFVDDEGKTHCRAHLMMLAMQHGPAAFVAMLQGIRGYDDSLARLREHIEALGGTPWHPSLVQGLLAPGLAAYTGESEIVIASDETAFEAATDIIAAHLPVARVNEAGIIADYDTECLHEYRVQLRKIRSVLSLFKGVYDDEQVAGLKARFSAIMTRTNRLRDLDVYLLDQRGFYELVPDTMHAGLDALFGMLAKHRAQELAIVSDYLDSDAYKREIAGLARMFSKPGKLNPGVNAGLPAHDYACGLIWKRYRTICKIAASIGPRTPDAEVHVLRIHCKKLRYLMEFFGPVFPQEAFRSLLRPLKRLQENLGLFNDYSVQQVNLQAALDQWQGEQGGATLEVAQSVGALIAVLHGRQLKERAKVARRFVQFNSPETQHTFSELFKKRKEEA